MELFGFKVDKEILLSSSLFLNSFLVILFLAIVKLAFGKEIKSVALFFWDKFTTRNKNKKIDKWIAKCIERQGWKQKADGYPLELEGRHLKKLSFEVSPLGRPTNWRGGFIMGNEKYQPQSIVDTDNSVLFHAGSPPPIAQAQYIWYYDKDHIENYPASTTVTKENKTKIRFKIEINNNNYLKVLVNGQQVYNTKIPASFRDKAYILGWGDHADCRVEFNDIKYTI